MGDRSVLRATDRSLARPNGKLGSQQTIGGEAKNKLVPRGFFGPQLPLKGARYFYAKRKAQRASLQRARQKKNGSAGNDPS